MVERGKGGEEGKKGRGKQGRKKKGISKEGKKGGKQTSVWLS